MRRVAILSAFATLLGLGLGCKNTSGKCDCNYDAANHALPAPGANYPTVGPVVGPAPIKEAK